MNLQLNYHSLIYRKLNCITGFFVYKKDNCFKLNDLNGINEIFKLSIYDALGRELFNGISSNNTWSCNKKFSTGIYYFRIQGVTKFAKGRIIIEN